MVAYQKRNPELRPQGQQIEMPLRVQDSGFRVSQPLHPKCLRASTGEPENAEKPEKPKPQTLNA